MKIQVIDPIFSKVIKQGTDQKEIDKLDDILRYPIVIWEKKTQWGVKNGKRYSQGTKTFPRTTYHSFLKKNKEFYTGFLPKIQQEIPNIKIIDQISRSKIKYPKIEGITFRDYQKKGIRKALMKQRGVLVHPTGSGKGVMLLGITSAVPGNTLILCHSVDIVKQIYNDAVKFKFKDIVLLGGGNNQWFRNGKIVIATIQTFNNMNYEDYCDYFSLVLIDEVHRFSNMYRKFMETCLAPIRIGLTATYPSAEDRALLIEGNLGPVLDNFTSQEATRLEILSKPVIKMIKTPVFTTVHKDYNLIYQDGIVNNEKRNQLIVREALKLSSGKSCLILVKNLQHGRNIKNIFKRKGRNITFIEGKTSSMERNLVKQQLSEKKQKIIIATVVWMVGINIPSLDCIIYALSGKSDIQVIQACGRCLRKTDVKNKAIIIDFIDNDDSFVKPYLRNHSLDRIETYKKQNWNIKTS